MTVGELILYLSKFKDSAEIVLIDKYSDVYDVDYEMDQQDKDASVCWIPIVFTTHCDGC